MKATDLIGKLQELVEISRRVPGRTEDDVLVVSEDGKSISSVVECYSDDNPFAAGILLKTQATVDRHRPKVQLQNAAFELCALIEALPAGEQQTAARVAAAQLQEKIEQFLSKG